MRERVRAPAKVNLRLRVHGLEPSGFHRLDTLFCRLELADELTVDLEDGAGVRLDVEGADLGAPDENLAVRAARGFLAAAGLDRGVAIRLRKRIPAGGGLGGGSSDAAAVLAALDRLLPGAVPAGDVRELARTLGSDVPFFLMAAPLARGTGRGDILEPAPALPSAPVLLLLPGFPVSTAEAYRWLDDDRAAGEASPAGSPEPPPMPAPSSWDDVARQARNDFEGPVFRRHPALRALREGLLEARARVALLSGTGSTLFGVFDDEERLGEALALLRARAPHVRLEATRTAAV